MARVHLTLRAPKDNIQWRIGPQQENELNLSKFLRCSDLEKSLADSNPDVGKSLPKRRGAVTSTGAYMRFIFNAFVLPKVSKRGVQLIRKDCRDAVAEIV